MNRTTSRSALCILLVLGTVSSAADPLEFAITADPTHLKAPYTGRVYVMLSRDAAREPRRALSWVDPPPVFAVDVTDWTGATPVIVGAAALAHPTPLGQLPTATYGVQAVVRCSTGHPVPGSGPGDLHSIAHEMALDPATSGRVTLIADQVVERRAPADTERIRHVELPSARLTAFHGRPIAVHAAVALPAGWSEAAVRRYPVLVVVTGFGGNPTHSARQMAWLAERLGYDDDVLIVVPDANCRTGHSVFADSDNNGPWGAALVDELLPHIESTFHGTGDGQHRYVTGVSSGGWSALWLQVRYPDAFNGCYAHAPDPVDFRDFQQIDLYAPGANMFRDATGQRRPIMRRGATVALWYDDFAAMEVVLGDGGQLGSFEAVFSPRGPDGRPRPLWDRATGAIDPKVAAAWRRYDIRALLLDRWAELGPRLETRLHVYGGGRDAFYLEGAVQKLADTLRILGSQADVVVIASAGHGPMMDRMQPMFETIVAPFASAEPNAIGGGSVGPAPE